MLQKYHFRVWPVLEELGKCVCVVAIRFTTTTVWEYQFLAHLQKTCCRYSLLPMWGAAGLGAGVVQWAASGLTGGSPEGARDKGSGKKLGRVAALVSVELMLLENVQERILLVHLSYLEMQGL